MNIFGFSFFEKYDPELENYRLDIIKREYKSRIERCEKDNLVDVDLYCLDLYGSDSDENRLKEHRKLSNKGICHIFNYKKYCYHKGKEIISVQK